MSSSLNLVTWVPNNYVFECLNFEFLAIVGFLGLISSLILNWVINDGT